MMPTRRGTDNLPGSGRESWPPRHATRAASSVSTKLRLSKLIRKGDEGKKAEKETYLNLDCGNDYFFRRFMFQPHNEL